MKGFPSSVVPFSFEKPPLLTVNLVLLICSHDFLILYITSFVGVVRGEKTALAFLHVCKKKKKKVI